jgi:hypothetical protein
VVVTYANPVGGSGWHRAKLIDESIEHFGEWWLVGYQGGDPGWGAALGMTWTDVTNEYIIYGVQYGLIGLMVFVGVLINALLLLHKSYKITKIPCIKHFIWALGCIVVTLMVIFNSCSFFGQLYTFLFCIIGMISSLGGIVKMNISSQPVQSKKYLYEL